MDPASAAGIALSVTSLSFQLFAGCVRGFVFLSTAHNLGRDASFLRTMLKVEEYRFVQWADVVGLTSPDSKTISRINPALAEELMVHLQDRFDQNKLKERYKLELVASASSTHVVEEGIEMRESQDILAKAVSDEKRGEILARAKLIQNKNKLPKRLWWAAVDKSRFEDLIRDVGRINDALWTLLEPQRQAELSQQIERALSIVIKTSKDLDGLRGLQLSLSIQTETPRAQTSLATAAGLKIVREQLPDENDAHPTTTGDSTALSIIHAQNKPLEPLNSTLLKRNIGTSGSNGTCPAEYADKPVLVEYKRVNPRMKAKLRTRAENLAILLSQPKQPGFSTLKCMGFLEDKDHFAFVYEYPVDPYTLNGGTQQSLQDFLRGSKTQPPSVTVRIKLALEICRTVLTVHTAGWLHKNIRSENVLFFPSPSTSISSSVLGKPFLTGFTFSRANSPVEISDQASEDPQLDIYRHPHALGEPSASYAMYMDMYSLGVVLIEISEWRPLKYIIKKHVDVMKQGVDVPLSDLSGIQNWLVENQISNGQVHFRMGEIYAKGLSLLLNDPIPFGQEQREEEELLAFQHFVLELSQCRV
jgi:Prion-inhibition and propagation